MNKRFLAKIPIETATEDIILFAQRMVKVEYVVTASTIDQEDKKILLMNFYPHKDLKEGKTSAEFRVFFTHDNYITQDLTVQNIKWKTSAIKSLFHGWYWYNWCVSANQETENTIKKYLGCKEEPYKIIDSIQSEIMANRLSEKHKNTKARIDSQMELVPELPTDFEEWINEKALYSSRYIFYDYKRKNSKLDGYCTYCKSDVVIDKPRHNAIDICPSCGSEITYKAKGKTSYIIDRIHAAIIQKTKDNKGFVIRYFSVYRRFEEYNVTPETSFVELSRTLYCADQIKTYEHAEFKQSGETRWCDYRGVFNIFGAVLYTNNIDNVLGDTKYKYCAIKQFAEHAPAFTFNMENYLYQFTRYPFIEYLVKLKLNKITNEIIDGHTYHPINVEGKKLEDILKISKNNLCLLQELDSSMDELELVQKMDELKLVLKPDLIKYIGENLGVATKLLKISKYATVHKAIKYLKQQAKKIKVNGQPCSIHYKIDVNVNKKISLVYKDWCDYIQFCEELNLQLDDEFILFPKNLIEAHDMRSEEVQIKRDKAKAIENEIMERKISELYEQLNNLYGMNYKGYVVRPPMGAQEIKQEGQTLHHCVGTYIKDMVAGKTIILFIRKQDSPETPFATLEVKNNKIIQCQGKNHISMRETLKSLLTKFEKTKLVQAIETEAM